MKYSHPLSSALLIALLRITAAETIRGGGVTLDEGNILEHDRSRVSRILKLFHKHSRRAMQGKEDYNPVFDQEYEKRQADLDPALLYFPKFIPVFQMTPPTESPAPSTQGPTLISATNPPSASTSTGGGATPAPTSPTATFTSAPTAFPTSPSFVTPSPTTSGVTSAPAPPTISPKPTLTNAPTAVGVPIPSTPPLLTSPPTIGGTFGTPTPGVIGTGTPTFGLGTPAPSMGSAVLTNAPTFTSAATLAPTIASSLSSTTGGSMSAVRMSVPTSMSPVVSSIPSMVPTLSSALVSSLAPTPPSTSDEPTTGSSSTEPSTTSVPTLMGSTDDASQRSEALYSESFLLGQKSSLKEMKMDEFWSTLFRRQQDSVESP